MELALAGAWIVGLGAGLQLIEQILGPANPGGAIFGAIAVDLATGRAGVRWDWEDTEGSPRSFVLGRLAKGLGATIAIVVAVVGVSSALHWAEIGSIAVPGFALAFAAARAAAFAVRDELLFRGLPYAAAARVGLAPRWPRAFGALAGGAAVMLTPGATVTATLFAVTSGLFFASLWERDRGAWSAIGAHFALRFLVGSVLHGGLFDLGWAKGELAVGAAASGPPTWLAIALFGAASAVLLTRPGGAARHGH